MAEWSKALAWKVSIRHKRIEGSNPSRSASHSQHRNRKRELPLNTILGQLVTIRDEGRERRVTAAEAFAETIARRSEPSSLVIGIHGPWGDGKASDRSWTGSEQGD